MSTSDLLPAIDRRALLRSAILLVGGSVAGLPAEALAQAATAKPKRFFSDAQFAVMSEVVDIMIPRTDTPGAKDAGVPEALDAMMTNWASKQRQGQMRKLVEGMGGLGLLSAPKAQRLDIVRKMDADRFAARDGVYARFKELVLTLYYLSEAGATKELRYELIPGKWEPATTVGTDTRAWAA